MYSTAAMSETDICIQFVQYIRIKYPNLVFTHVANERKCSLAYGAKLKAQGLRAGFADYVFFAPSGDGKHFLLLIEMKSAKGTLTKNQRKFRDDVRVGGWYKYEVCNELDLAIKTLDDYMRVTDDWSRKKDRIV